MFSAADHEYMARALRLAELGLYSTTPNPRVGCLLVKDGQVVGEGWHQRAGEAHAEIHALQAAGSAARGATAYVTLGPGSHHGRTPPCAGARWNWAAPCAPPVGSPTLCGPCRRPLRRRGRRRGWRCC